MDEWKRLCSHVDTEGRILSRLEENGISSHLKQAVLRDILSPSVDVDELEKAVYNIVASSSEELQFNNWYFTSVYM